MRAEKKNLIHEEYQFTWFEAGEGMPLVLLPGFGEGAKNLLRLTPFLGPHFRLILLDTPGFGHGEPLELVEYRYERQIPRLMGFFQALGLERVILGGNSAGGNLALAFAHSEPKMVAKLVLLNPQGVQTNDFDPYQHKAKMPQGLEDFDRIMQELYHQPPELNRAAKDVLLKRMQERFDWLNDIRAEIRRGQYRILNSCLSAIEQETLVIWGDMDRRIPSSMGAFYESLMPRCQLKILPKVGHLPQIEAPEATARLILPFLGVEEMA